jgi:hypothetical protein
MPATSLPATLVRLGTEARFASHATSGVGVSCSAVPYGYVYHSDAQV